MLPDRKIRLVLLGFALVSTSILLGGTWVLAG
jgi:hypothetical protein